mmetsp:Transcript_28196/g.61552  ORF Transcript_28196/g.61552 Transcript_28196/m.61552 type:complete len:270 (-) Transcript_28196:161-970(-)
MASSGTGNFDAVQKLRYCLWTSSISSRTSRTATSCPRGSGVLMHSMRGSSASTCSGPSLKPDPRPRSRSFAPVASAMSFMCFPLGPSSFRTTRKALSSSTPTMNWHCFFPEERAPWRAPCQALPEACQGGGLLACFGPSVHFWELARVPDAAAALRRVPPELAAAALDGPERIESLCFHADAAALEEEAWWPRRVLLFSSVCRAGCATANRVAPTADSSSSLRRSAHLSRVASAPHSDGALVEHSTSCMDRSSSPHGCTSAAGTRSSRD